MNFQAEKVLARIAHQLTIQRLIRQLAEQNADLKKLNAELRRSNAELEQFASVAAYDLRAPLTVMIAYAKLLAAYYEISFDTKAQNYLDRIVGAGARMDRLIDDLLSYSRATPSSFLALSASWRFIINFKLTPMPPTATVCKKPTLVRGWGVGFIPEICNALLLDL
jgi:signal transduction histidine kinase